MKGMQLVCGVLAGLLVTTATFAQEEPLDHPGYIDFSELMAIAGDEPSVEVNLKEPLLNLITNILRNNDEEAAQFISTLRRVNVRVFDSSRIDRGRMVDTMSAIAGQLDAENWERVVRVREGSDHVDVYFRLSEDAQLIHGITILVAEPGDTVLVNIVGDISPGDLSTIGTHFDIEELSGLDYAPPVD